MKILICSDMHCGHKAGLTHKDDQPEIAGEEPEVEKRFRDNRRTIWDWFETTINQLRPFHKLILNGDAVDGTGEKSGGVELLAPDRMQQVDWAVKIIRFINAGENYIVKGTHYHTGEREDWERIIAEKVNAKGFDDRLYFDFYGLKCEFSHHIGTAQNALKKAQSMSYLNIIHAAMLQGADIGKPVNLIVRSHIHRCYNYGNSAFNFQGWTTPGLMGPGARYARKMIDNEPIDIGFLILNVESVSNWGIEAHICPFSPKNEIIVERKK